MTEPTSPLASPMPSAVGRYQITGTLGFGAMGAVYKAFDPLIKRTLAIKTIRLDVPRQSPQYASFIERFYREARISGTLSHPNIVTLFDIGEEAGVPFLAMEFVDGRTVAAVIEEGIRFKPEKVVGLVSQVAAAIDYAHTRGVVHRDIKPSNLILYEADKVKVTDFGIAKLADSEITHAGVLLGTPSYMSPEQAMGEKLDGRSDIFSLGVCAFEMLSGQQPFPGANVTAILYKLVHVDPVEPADLETNGLVPDKWREVFHKALAKKPDNRYQTAAAFVQDLEYCLGSWFTGLGAETVRMTAADVGAAAGPPAVETLRAGAGEVEATIRLDAPLKAPAGSANEPTVALRPQAPPVATPDEVPTLMLRPESSHLAAPAPVASPATSDDARTVRIAAPGSAAVPPPAGPAFVPDPDEAATVVLKAEPSREAPGMSPQPRAAGRAAKGPMLPLLLGGAALLAFVIAGVVLWPRLRSGAPVALPSATAAPLAEASPTAEPSATPAATGSILVETSPAGGNVIIDGEPHGQAPVTIPDLLPGSYDVRVERAGFEPQAKTVALSAEAPAAQVRFNLVPSPVAPGSAEILSAPAGAVVSVDGRELGHTPLRALSLRPGPRRLQLVLAGHQPWSGTVDVVSGQKARVEVRLRAIPVPRDTPTPEPIDLARVYAEEELDARPRKLSGTSPSYPERGVRRLKSGERVSVRVQFVVSAAGEVKDPTVIESGGAVLDELVVSAIRTWKFQPGNKRGTAVQARTTFTLTFLGA